MKRSALVSMFAVSAAGAALLAGLGAGGLGARPAMAQAPGGPGACSGLQAAGLFKDTTVTSAQVVAADAAKGTPTFCEVTGTISPEPRSHIGVVYRLPEGWNGKIVGFGGGGWAGNTRIETALQALKRGYATAQTDGGHNGANVWDTSWATNPAAVADFSWRAIHLMTLVSKDVAARYYGHRQTKTIYQGCSTGGRMGLIEVQRFPTDYDAATIGAPVYNLLVQTSAMVRDQTFTAPGAGFTNEQLAMVQKAALGACDARDGARDGLIADPRRCAWDPASIQCKAGQTGEQCLSGAQVNALHIAYGGLVLKDGRRASWPLAKGGEAGWPMFLQINPSKPDATNGGGMGSLGKIITGDESFSLESFRPDRDVARIRDSQFARDYEANDPKIAPFIRRGGKLLLWHGWSDAGPSPVGTIDYFEKVRAANPNSGQSVRLFLEPGVYHCGGGPGPDQVDLLSAIDDWSRSGKAPDTLLATKAKTNLSRPLCPYPQVAVYTGHGDQDAASSYACRMG